MMISDDPCRKRLCDDTESTSRSARRRVKTPAFRTALRGTRFCRVEGIATGETLYCRRQPENPADANAIAVYREEAADERVGYLPREASAVLAPWIDAQRLELDVIVRDVRVQRAGSTGIDVVVSVLPVKGGATTEGIEIDVLVQEVAESIHGSFSSRVLCQNLAVIVRLVAQQESHLLTLGEREHLRCLLNLSTAATALLMRLYIRKGTSFRTREMDFLERHILDNAVKELTQLGWMGTSEEASVHKRITILTSTVTLNEIKEFLKQARLCGISCHITGNKPKLTAELTRILYQNEACVYRLMEAIGPCVCVGLNIKKTLAVVQQLYFLDPTHSLSSFLLQELDILKWPKYEQTICQPVFPTRAAFDSYFHALQQLTLLESAVQNGAHSDAEAVLEQIWPVLDSHRHKMAWSCHGTSAALPNDPVTAGSPLPLFLARFSSSWVAVEAAWVGVAYLEKRKRYAEAVEKLRVLLGGNACPSRRGKWWNRLIIDLQHLKKHNTALETCTSALADTWVRHGDRMSIKRQILKLSKPPRRWKLPPWASQLRKPIQTIKHSASPINHDPGVKSQFIGRDGQIVSVEQLALEYYGQLQNGSWQGMHTEGSLWHTLYGVLFWNVIFSSVEDVFRSPFQSAPLDFGTDAFYYNRQDGIHATLEIIRSGDVEQLFRENWTQHYGELCRGVNWERFTLELCLEVLHCTGGARLASICHIMAQDYKAVSGHVEIKKEHSWMVCIGGLPDLFLWNVERHSVMLVEVKGPNDRLSDSQRAWLDVRKEANFTVEIFQVVNEPTPVLK